MLEFRQQTYRQSDELFTIDELQLELGNLVVLFGANGTGKSTWLRSIIRPITNDYTIEGKSAKALNADELAKTIAFVDHSFRGLDHLMVHEFLELGRFPHTGISGRLSLKDKEVIHQIVNQLQISHLTHKSTTDLSDGERQRCMIARALIQETPIILLDEPTSFLDYPSKIELFKVLQDICRQENKLIIVSTHDLEMGIEYGTNFCIISPNKEFIHFKQALSKPELLKLSFGI